MHDVVAHMIDAATTTRLGFARRMAAARFDFDRDDAIGVRRERRSTPGETLAAFHRILSRTSTPPAPRATRLVEAVVHGEDVRRPLGIRRDHPVAHVPPALALLLRTSTAMGGGRERAAGYRLEPTDADVAVASGAGPTVRGSAVDLLLAVSGRPVEPAAFAGSGADAFARSLGTSR